MMAVQQLARSARPMPGAECQPMAPLGLMAVEGSAATPLFRSRSCMGENVAPPERGSEACGA
jgi:hypothetical protein